MLKRERKRCPECAAIVRIDRIEEHVARLHPKADRSRLLTEVEKKHVGKSKRASRARPITKRETGLYLVGIVIILIAVIALVLSGPSGLKVGDKAPDFTLKDTNGGTVSLSDHNGRVILLNLMDAKCGYCKEETKSVLVGLFNSYRSKVIFISVDIQILGTDSADTLNNFKTNTGAEWQYCLDVNSIVKNQYKVGGTPTNFIIDPSSMICYIDHGDATIKDLSEQLDKALE